MSKIIKLTRGYETIVDDEDFEMLSKYKWYAILARPINKNKKSYKPTQKVYAKTFVKIDGKRTTVSMSRLIMNAPPGFQVDHACSTLDNRKINLTLKTNQHNSFGSRKQAGNKTSKYKGVSFYRDKWRVEITCNGIRHRAGGYLYEDNAARVYNCLAIQYFGEHAFLNTIC